MGQKETETAAFASLTAADVIRAPVVQRMLPLDFRPLLKPFKRAGRLCLRIERLPQGAKLSAGRRNTDNSWSLASDELEDLNYLIPSNISRDHELTIRVMTFEDGAASTLKVSQFAITASDTVPVPEGREPHGNEPVIRSQLSEMHSLFAVRESELRELRAALERAVGEKEAELIKARIDWERALDRKVAEAVSQCRLQDKLENEGKEADHKSKAAQEERKTEQRIAAERDRLRKEFESRSEAERRKWQIDSEQRIAALRKEWQADADRSLDDARKAWQAKTDDCLRTEIEKLRTHNEKRIDTERQNWQAQADEQAAKERERWKVEADQVLETARLAWQAETEERIRTEREGWVAESEKRIEGERQKWQSLSETQAATERERWRSDADQHLEAERQKWQLQSENQAAAERERWKSDANQQLEAARQTWQLEADERRKSDRESWKADTEKRVEDERQRWLAKASEEDRTEFERAAAEIESRIQAERQTWQIEADERASKDRTAWEAETEQRIEAARQTCRTDADAQLAAERDRLRAEAEQFIQAERQRHESELRAAAMAAAERGADADGASPVTVDDQVVRESYLALEEERFRSTQLNAALVAEAEKAREMEMALAAMTERCETAERAAVSGEKPAPIEPDDGYIKGLRAEIATLRKSLTNQAAELARARASLEQSRPMHIQRGLENKPLGNLRDVFAEDEDEGGEDKKKGLIRDCILVAAVVIPIILFYPWVAVYLPDPVRDGIATATGGLLSVEIEKPVVKHVAPKKPVPVPQVSRPTGIASRVLNVRETPATTATVLVSLQKGASVQLLEKQGNWTRIEVPADGPTQARQGWVWSAYLQDKEN